MVDQMRVYEAADGDLESVVGSSIRAGIRPGLTLLDLEDREAWKGAASAVSYVPEDVVRGAIQSAHRATVRGPIPLYVPEFSVVRSQARIDLAAVSTELLGWEIKTRRDNLARLGSQAAVYSKVFDRLWLVSDAKHLEKATELLPPWWGIQEIQTNSRGFRLVRRRPARRNPEVELNALVKLLWRDEALGELRELGLSTGIERAARTEIWETLAQASPRLISAAELRRRVRLRLTSRRDWRAGS